MKKILTIAAVFIMVLSLSANVFATGIDLDDTYIGSDVKTGTSEELIGLNFPDGLTFSTGERVTVHFVGSSDGDFRVWLSHVEGVVTMTPNPIWKASENGFASGAFDFTIELEVGDKDGTGQTIADSIIFKAPFYGGTLDNFSLSLVEIVDGKDNTPATPEVVETEPEAAPEPDAPAKTDTPVEPVDVPQTGIALVIFPSVIAFAAAIASKKR